MPRGDAARIRAYAVGLVDDARAAGETGMTVRAGDVREALELDYRKALINICQVLGTRKLQGEAGVELVARRGPSQGLNSVFEFRLLGGRVLPPDAGGGLTRARGPCEPARRRPTFRAGASGLCADAQFGRDQLPGHWGPGGLRWETVRREGDHLGRSRLRALSRWTVLPSLLRHDGREGEGGTLCHRHRRATVAHCYHWLLPVVRLLRNWVASLSPRFSSMVLPFGEGSGRASSKILSVDSLGCLCARAIPEAGQPRSGI